MGEKLLFVMNKQMGGDADEKFKHIEVLSASPMINYAESKSIIQKGKIHLWILWELRLKDGEWWVWVRNETKSVLRFFFLWN